MIYVNTTNAAVQVVLYENQAAQEMEWIIIGYDTTTETPDDTFYVKYDIGLNGSDWVPEGGTGTVTTSCPQFPFTKPFSVAAGKATNVPLRLSVILENYDAVQSNSVHVTASSPVSVYGEYYFVPDEGDGTAIFTCYPTPMLGTNYCVMAYPDEFGDGPDNGYSQLTIVGTETNTTVTITPSATADLTNHASAYSINLNQGQTYEIRDNSVVGDDVTGTFVKADKPIGVFAGESLDDVPNIASSSANPLIQEQLPVNSWGTNVLTISFAGRTRGDLYRILTAESNTVIILNNGIVLLTTNLAAGTFCDTNLDGPVQFQSTKPIQVAQFANSYTFDNPAYGDPCEVLLPSIANYLASYVVYSLTNDNITGDFYENYLNVIVPQSATNNTFLDGSLIVVTNFVPIGSSGYYGAQITITNSGAHTVNSSKPIEVQAYGFGGADSLDAYSYFGGITK